MRRRSRLVPKAITSMLAITPYQPGALTTMTGGILDAVLLLAHGTVERQQGVGIVEGPAPTPTMTPRPASAEDDGCAITAGRVGPGVWLLAPVIISWLYRRRRGRAAH